MEDTNAGLAAHIGRQPIYDREGAVVAYELLFRAGGDAAGAVRTDEHATARVLVAAFTEFGVEELAGAKVCFLNVTKQFLTGVLPLPFDYSQAVLEVQVGVDVDESLVAGLTVLSERGYTIAIDRFRCGGPREVLLPLVTYVKIDMLDADEATVRAAVAVCRQYAHVELVALRVETPEALRLAFELGFDLFQGHILGRPHVDTTVALAPDRLARLRVLSALTADDVNLDEVVALVSQDPALSMRVLRATNAATFGLTRTVTSVREAIVAMGLNRLRQWVTLMLVSDLTTADHEQLARILVRARLCQLLAGSSDYPAAAGRGDAAYLAGLLSAVADHFGVPVDRIIAGLPLDPELPAALSTGAGPLGEILHAVRAYTDPDHEDHHLEPGVIVAAYLSALRWTTGILGELGPEIADRAEEHIRSLSAA
ncbi:HDOD domain-containing protein [Dactylosporangium vinaceum]|uniref:EAL and HDOD domain-containing protein n=1 Tax=Dactylosporangium vinaceum TaxID=53362 RepID=A0ABV5M289_9ACTN|nr:HDOD domain-containing protein [Dactylosporangium vinaceum]UAB99436.1 HDOD domain-containing protein [Dactylosporangium vinaceum]